MALSLPLLLPVVPVLLWCVLRVGTPRRIRRGAWLPAAVLAAGAGVALALGSMARQVTHREEATINAALLYDAVGAAGTGLVGAALGAGLVLAVELLWGSRRPARGPASVAPWVAGVVGVGALGFALRGCWALMRRVGEMALVMDQRAAGLPARAVDTSAIATELFTTAGFTAVALVLGGLGVLFGLAPPQAEPPAPSSRAPQERP